MDDEVTASTLEVAARVALPLNIPADMPVCEAVCAEENVAIGVEEGELLCDELGVPVCAEEGVAISVEAGELPCDKLGVPVCAELGVPVCVELGMAVCVPVPMGIVTAEAEPLADALAESGGRVEPAELDIAGVTGEGVSPGVVDIGAVAVGVRVTAPVPDGDRVIDGDAEADGATAVGKSSKASPRRDPMRSEPPKLAGVRSSVRAIVAGPDTRA